MTAYTPHNLEVAEAVLAIGAAVFLIGMVVNRSRVQPIYLGLAWCFAAAAVCGIEYCSINEPAGVRMVAIILALLWCMKLVVLCASRLDSGPSLAMGRWLGFAFGWPGMQPALFARPLRPNPVTAMRLLIQGVVRLICGMVCILVARHLATRGTPPPLGNGSSICATLILLTGLSLVLHFGFFNLLAAGWQVIGIPCQPVFRAPLNSSSLSEFWSRRWNLAFSEMTALAVYRPCLILCAPKSALFTGFIFSGILHELAITVPVKSGYGGPMSYFLLHGALVLLERRFDLPRRCGCWYRVWMIIWLTVPLPMLFPTAFLRDIVWPLAGK